MNAIAFGTKLYRLVKNASEEIREQVTDVVHEALQIGALPLGMIPGRNGEYGEYRWFVFDRKVLDAAVGSNRKEDRLNFLYRRTPLGLRIILLDPTEKEEEKEKQNE